jgi:ferrochelatase
MTILHSDAGGQTSSRKIGVLLRNLGTPDGTDYWSVRRCLSEFLSDRRMVGAPRLLWLLVLNLLILATPPRKDKDYAAILNYARNESPLKTITRSQAEKLEQLRACSETHLAKSSSSGGCDTEIRP